MVRDIMKLRKMNSGNGKKFWVIVALLTLSLGTYVSAASPTQASAGNNQGDASQFLTLPLHPRVLAEAGEEGIGAGEEGHYIWKAPFVNGQPPGQTRGNSPLGPSTYSAALTGINTLTPGADIVVSNAPSSYEGETGAASNGLTIVAGSNHIFPGSCGSNPCAVLAYTSTDGVSWTKTQMSRIWNGATFGITFDPALDYDTSGNFYYVFGGAPLSGSYPNSIAVAKSGSDGLSWRTPVAVTFNRNKYFDDKYYIAVDRSPNLATKNRIYVSWDRNTATNQILYIAYSTNGGSTWSAPIKVDDGTTSFERVIGAYPAVDQNTGVVYDSWHNYAKNIIFVDKSTNGGVSWGKDVAVATTHTGFGKDIGCVGGRSQSPAHHLKVGPSGTLYLVYADEIAGRGYDILLTKSTNGGATWNTPITLNDDSGPAHQFHPTLSVESNGIGGDKVTVTFYDRRDDATNNCLSNVYSTQSIDNGASWSPNIKVTGVASNFNGNANGPGDYSSSTPSNLSVFPFFSDHRSDFEIYTAKLQ